MELKVKIIGPNNSSPFEQRSRSIFMVKIQGQGQEGQCQMSRSNIDYIAIKTKVNARVQGQRSSSMSTGYVTKV